ncbi:hypothetical protein PHMEG_0009893 [Phytophthora megakarya]|uniref:Uncharacterized protein n=1 Tax=Phytophthora megakarya TaxID=4795 RepID=A0A225WH40_9STRA|nr:hypothetical protein PHMEG_0009893 [Phytophthora megakarya]
MDGKRIPTSPTSLSGTRFVIDALRGLRVFWRQFYNHDVLDWIDVSSAFIDSYKGGSDTDDLCWKLFSYWVTNKFSKFRGFIVPENLTRRRTGDRAHECNNQDHEDSRR